MHGGRKGRKRFFFEKKKQKTFAYWMRGHLSVHGPQEQKFFCFFFFKKRSAYFLPASPALLIQVNAPRPKIRFP